MQPLPSSQSEAEEAISVRQTEALKWRQAALSLEEKWHRSCGSGDFKPLGNPTNNGRIGLRPRCQSRLG
eukprot:1157327-Pelagomonas_calceolata.AAC.7